MFVSLYGSLHVKLLSGSTLGQVGRYRQLFRIFLLLRRGLFGPRLLLLVLRLFVVVLLLLGFHILHLVLSLFIVTFEFIITSGNKTFSHLDQGDLSARVDAELFESLVERVRCHVCIFLFLSLVLHHDNALVLPSGHEGVPHHGLSAHCLLKFILWINL